MADLIKYAFVAGEMSPTLFGRTDLEKYDLGLALARNWFVDYRGGLSTRPGSEFIDFVQNDDEETKFVPFRFAPNVNSTYVLIFARDYIRFVQNGAYILEPGKTITGITQASPGVVTAVAHGYSTGDWVKIFDVEGMTELNARTFEVGATTTDTFELLDPFGNDFDTSGLTAYTSAGSVYRIYTVTSPYAPDDLEILRAHQSRSAIILTHPDYATHKLTRVTDTNWTLNQVAFENGLDAPTNLAITTAAGTAGVGFTVTAVDSEGVESLPAQYVFDTTITDYSSAAGQAKVTWDAVTGAVLYRVYRTNIITTGADVSRAMQVGFIGVAYGTEFVDNNIIPDFTITPPDYYNPFADAAVDHIEVTAGGTGYTASSVVSVSGGSGSGFVGYPVVNSSGAIIAIVIVNGGSGYESPTVSVTGGSGATFTATLTEAEGNNPAVSTVFQQRRIYAATQNEPLTVWGSQPGEPDNFDVSQIVQEDDSYEFELDSDEVAPIRHLLPTRSGLVIFSQAGIWQLTGGSGVAVTPTNALADPQSYTGCSIVPPLPVDTDILYIEGKGATVRLLSYNDYSKVFAGQDLSILSNHLTDPAKPIKTWTFASDPFKLVHAVRSDGVMLNLTLVKEQNVFGWATAQTKGLYKDVLSIQEGLTDTVYTMVQRLINGRYTKMIEKVARRDFVEVEDAWCVDAGLTNTPTYPAATLTAAAATGNGVIFTASAAVFASGDVGKVIRGGGCKAVIAGFTDTTHVTANIITDFTDVLPEDDSNTPLPVLEGDWTMDEPVTTVSGLWHLEGETVKVLADGNVLDDKVVSNGAITLDTAATRIIVGLGYTCLAKTLPPTTTDDVIESKKKRIVGIKARVYQTRGLRVGAKVGKMYEFKERTDERYGEPTRMQEGVKPIIIEADYNREGQVFYQQTHPLPATILGFIKEIDIGDVSN